MNVQKEKKNFIIPVNDILIAPRFNQRARSSRETRVLVARSVRSLQEQFLRFELHRSLITDRQWRDLRKRKTGLSLIPHNWSLKCIFFKWNIKKKRTLYYIYTFSFTHTHPSTSHLFLFVCLFVLFCFFFNFFCYFRSIRRTRVVSRFIEQKRSLKFISFRYNSKHITDRCRIIYIGEEECWVSFTINSRKSHFVNRTRRMRIGTIGNKMYSPFAIQKLAFCLELRGLISRNLLNKLIQ